MDPYKYNGKFNYNYLDRSTKRYLLDNIKFQSYNQMNGNANKSYVITPCRCTYLEL